MSLYTDKAAIQKYTVTNINVSFDTQLDEWIEAMSRFMDGYTGRTLVVPDEAPTTRLYDGNGEYELLIDDAHSITEVTVDDTVVTPYQYPANKARKNRLVLTESVFTTGNQNVEVTGSFGYYAALADAPDIKFACTVLVAGIVSSSNNQDDAVQSEKIGQYSVTYKTEEQRADYKRAMQILDTHRVLAF